MCCSEWLGGIGLHNYEIDGRLAVVLLRLLLTIEHHLQRGYYIGITTIGLQRTSDQSLI